MHVHDVLGPEDGVVEDLSFGEGRHRRRTGCQHADQAGHRMDNKGMAGIRCWQVDHGKSEAFEAATVPFM